MKAWGEERGKGGPAGNQRPSTAARPAPPAPATGREVRPPPRPISGREGRPELRSKQVPAEQRGRRLSSRDRLVTRGIAFPDDPAVDPLSDDHDAS